MVVLEFYGGLSTAAYAVVRHEGTLPQLVINKILLNFSNTNFQYLSFICRSIALEFVLQPATDEEEAKVQDGLHQPPDL